MQKVRKPLAARPAPRRLKSRAAFTLVEVMMAFTILIAGICGGLTSLQSGFKAVDSARCSTLAAQIMQSRIEQLRLLNWTAINNPDPVTGYYGENRNVPVDGLVPASAADIAARFKLKQTILATTDGRSGIVNVNLEVEWTGLGNIFHKRSFVTRYSENGLYDYYFSSH
jgi:type II secretory pathway pseudopilin PulG